MTVTPEERENRAKIAARAITEDLQRRHPEFAGDHAMPKDKPIHIGGPPITQKAQPQRLAVDLTYANTSSAKKRIADLEEALRCALVHYDRMSAEIERLNSVFEHFRIAFTTVHCDGIKGRHWVEADFPTLRQAQAFHAALVELLRERGIKS